MTIRVNYSLFGLLFLSLLFSVLFNCRFSLLANGKIIIIIAVTLLIAISMDKNRKKEIIQLVNKIDEWVFFVGQTESTEVGVVHLSETAKMNYWLFWYWWHNAKTVAQITRSFGLKQGLSFCSSHRSSSINRTHTIGPF